MKGLAKGMKSTTNIKAVGHSFNDTDFSGTTLKG